MNEDESPKSKNIFISEIDCFVGKNIGKHLATQTPGSGVEDEKQDADLSNDKWEPGGPSPPKKNCFVINGTLRYCESDKPPFAKDILDYDDRNKFLEHVATFDVIIYDITVNPEQMKEVVWLGESLEKNSDEFVSKKTLILVTNLMSWVSTKPNDPDDPGFVESEYKRRKPHPKFKEYLECEKSILKLGKKHKKKFVTYVLACGVFYGCGEYLFRHLFKDAWSTQNELPVYLNGENILPTVHILDLARIIQCIINDPPKQRYIIVRDDGQFTLSEIVKAISSGLSNGVTRIYNEEDIKSLEIPAQITDILTMNLRIEPSTIKEDMQFPWISDSGIPTNISQLINEFIEEHQLKPLRICILGPPYIGKTTLAKELCKIYRLHHIHLKGLLYEYIRNLLEPIKAYEHLLYIRDKERSAAEMNSESNGKMLLKHNSKVDQLLLDDNETNESTTDVINPLNVNLSSDYSTKLLEPMNELLDSYEDEDNESMMTGENVTSDRKSNLGDNNELNDLEYYPLSPLPTWNSEDELEMLVNDCQERLEQLKENCNEFGKLNDETLIRLLVQKLLSKPCQNQGFILDGFPKTLQQAELLFRPDPDDVDDDDDVAISINNNSSFKSHHLIIPNYMIHLIGSNHLLLERFNKHYSFQHFNSIKQQQIIIKQQSNQQIEFNKNQYIEQAVNLKQFETYKERFDRRIQEYRSIMAPNIANLREILIDEANSLQGTNQMKELKIHQTEDGKSKSLSMEETSQKEEDNQQNEENQFRKKDNEMEITTEETKQIERQNEEEINENQHQTIRESIELELKLAHIPSIPEVPDETEENVLTYFDLREIHPIMIDMDKDCSPLIKLNGPQEACLEKVRKAIGKREAPKLPSIEIYPLKQNEYEIQEKAINILNEFELEKLRKTKEKLEKQKCEEIDLLKKSENDWNNWLSLLNTQNYQYAEAHSLPMRYYLMKYIMPELSKALLECSEIRPDDPVDFVAEYLLKTGISQ
ncbi:unnamed protein product [Schistosoma mattheei]|uniref:Adenylate kinase 7 n=1 Tax=Schistosoma mattheei TaxID=31246 RepID=A0AA85B3U6_9TREM|nr:unnamed protein product [Schistosoma mattheei]